MPTMGLETVFGVFCTFFSFHLRLPWLGKVGAVYISPMWFFFSGLKTKGKYYYICFIDDETGSQREGKNLPRA